MISVVDARRRRSAGWLSDTPWAVLLLAGATVGLTACGNRGPAVLTGSVMGTAWSVKIAGEVDETLGLAIQAQLDAVDARMSTYKQDSELSQFNRSLSTDCIGVSPELERVVAEAQYIAELTGGAFDVTAGPLVDLWGFGPEEMSNGLPDEAAIAAARAQVGFEKLGARGAPPALCKSHASLALDLSAIAKGFAVDRVATLLNERGITDYLVEIGGELKAKGRKAGGETWTIGVEQPLILDRRVLRTLPLRDLAAATSGDYRNFFEHNGIRYSHAIDPRTGYPVKHNLSSVTVLDPSAMTADAYATALLVLGDEAGFEFAVRHKVAALFVSRDGDRLTQRLTPVFVSLTATGG